MTRAQLGIFPERDGLYRHTSSGADLQRLLHTIVRRVISTF